ncbi:uncharacterized protein B0H18DRAFT_953404 [Fomitopsis serialis]|uniref:uncharacterized protein n=1 Tax=Fomitopsis serialis TaxID=139415 RepID=UPI002008B9D6|nr:uncharacterized protein B0H18DRAFT_953404 [Neoantrodia serialis]KAH9930164.1 hypothetical protein B0H18DRAFT_953404 [Neoantrodia serialis]
MKVFRSSRAVSVEDSACTTLFGLFPGCGMPDFHDGVVLEDMMVHGSAVGERPTTIASSNWCTGVRAKPSISQQTLSVCEQLLTVTIPVSDAVLGHVDDGCQREMPMYNVFKFRTTRDGSAKWSAACVHGVQGLAFAVRMKWPTAICMPRRGPTRQDVADSLSAIPVSFTHRGRCRSAYSSARLRKAREIQRGLKQMVGVESQQDRNIGNPVRRFVDFEPFRDRQDPNLGDLTEHNATPSRLVHESQNRNLQCRAGRMSWITRRLRYRYYGERVNVDV